VDEIVLTKHAYERFCKRVEQTDRFELIERLKQQLPDAKPHKRGYIELADVWWRYGIRDSVLILYTCYGRHHIDLPEAIRWAKRHRDRINLGGGEHIGNR
jgi:hypothetical protein